MSACWLGSCLFWGVDPTGWLCLTPLAGLSPWSRWHSWKALALVGCMAWTSKAVFPLFNHCVSQNLLLTIKHEMSMYRKLYKNTKGKMYVYRWCTISIPNICLPIIFFAFQFCSGHQGYDRPRTTHVLEDYVEVCGASLHCCVVGGYTHQQIPQANHLLCIQLYSGNSSHLFSCISLDILESYMYIFTLWKFTLSFYLLVKAVFMFSEW